VEILEGKSKNAKRRIRLTADARAILNRLYDLKEPYVFAGRNGTGRMSASTIERIFRKARKALGLPWDCVPHSARHTCGSKLDDAGATPFQIMAVLGHGSVTTTQRYVHSNERSSAAAI